MFIPKGLRPSGPVGCQAFRIWIFASVKICILCLSRRACALLDRSAARPSIFEYLSQAGKFPTICCFVSFAAIIYCWNLFELAIFTLWDANWNFMGPLNLVCYVSPFFRIRKIFLPFKFPLKIFYLIHFLEMAPGQVSGILMIIGVALGDLSAFGGCCAALSCYRSALCIYIYI